MAARLFWPAPLDQITDRNANESFRAKSWHSSARTAAKRPTCPTVNANVSPGNSLPARSAVRQKGCQPIWHRRNPRSKRLHGHDAELSSQRLFEERSGFGSYLSTLFRPLPEGSMLTSKSHALLCALDASMTTLPVYLPILLLLGVLTLFSKKSD
jgi:hypothetical protein